MAQRSKSVLKTYFETGKRPTQSQFEDLIDSLAAERPFKVYVALLNQISTNHPTANVLENNTGEDFFWSRENSGVYKVLLPSNISPNNIFISLNNQFRSNSNLGASTRIESLPNGNYLYIRVVSDDELLNTSIEIRFYYSGIVESTSLDIALERYTPYFKKNELKRDGNLLLPPYKFYNSYNGVKGDSQRMNNNESISFWKRMPDEYIVLPEIFDGKKNPHTYNLRTQNLCCYYSYYNTTDKGQHHFLKNCIKRARRVGANECVVNLGNDSILINSYKSILKTALLNRNDSGMKRITLIINNQITHHTIIELMQ